VIAHAESLGWQVLKSRGHIWGTLLCHHKARDGCKVRVFSTPRSPENHAKGLKRTIDKCRHPKGQP
jgi:hypothetical protein